MSDSPEHYDLVDRIYAVAMEPERFRELVDIWRDNLNAVDKDSLPVFSGDAETLDRHLQRADTILSLVSANEDSLPQPLQEKLNSESQAMMAVTKEGRIEALNHGAMQLFNIADGAYIKDLLIDETDTNIILRELARLSAISPDEEAITPSLFQITRIEGDQPLLITFSRWKTSGGRHFTLIKSSDFVWPIYLTPLVKTAFGLTGAESDIIKLIVEGQSTEQIAETRGSTIQTVRTQIKSLYAKTSTNNQSEFMRMAIGLTTLQLVDKDVLTGAYQRPENAKNIAYPLPDHRRLLSLPDGRIMDYAIFGPEEGKPCVFFHNEFLGDIWPVKLARLALQKKLRIILPARSFYGRSSPAPKGVINYEQTSEDLEVLFKYLDIKKAVMISQAIGGQYPLYHAIKYPERVAALVGIAPAFPFSDASHEEKMPKFTKFMASIVSRQPRMLDFIAKTGFMFHSRVGSKRFLETILSQSEPDMKIIKDPDNLDAIVRGFQYTSANEYRGFLFDYKTMVPDSRDLILKLHCPIFAVIGSDENNSRLDRSNSLISAGANITNRIAKGGGEMLVFSHPDLIIDTVIEAWNKGV